MSSVFREDAAAYTAGLPNAKPIPYESRVVPVLASALLFVMVMGMAGSVDVRALQAQAHRKRSLLCGVLCQFFLLPLIGYSVVSISRPATHIGLTLMIVVSSPGGSYSNWWCSVFNADLALSVAMTAVSTVLSSAMLPINLTLYMRLLYGAGVSIPWKHVFDGLVLVLVAIVAGVLISSFLPKLHRWMTRSANTAGILLICLTIRAAFVATDEDKEQKEGSPKALCFYILVATPFILAFLSSLCIASSSCLKLAPPERVAICIETCYQNTGLASAIALNVYAAEPQLKADATAVTLFYGALEIIVLATACVAFWQIGWTYAPRHGSLWQTLRGNFQPVAEPTAIERDEIEMHRQSG